MSSLNSGILSVVVPIYNEQHVLLEFHQRLVSCLEAIDMGWEILYVNDGSTDQSRTIIQRIQSQRVAVIDLSRNFGKEIAMTAGLDHASGEAVVIIDADLQDPPELIPDLIDKWREGFDVVYAKRISRDGETFLKKSTAKVFYRVMQSMSRVRIPEDTGDFRLLSRRAVNAVLELREQHRFMKGLFSWVGYPQISVEYHRNARFAGDTKFNYWKLWNFALEGITSFSTVPLRLATYVGLLVALWAFVYAIFVVIKTLVFGEHVAGYPSMMVAILFLGGVQLMSLGMIGEYLGRMFNETKKRPLYVIQEYLPAGSRITKAKTEGGAK